MSVTSRWAATWAARGPARVLGTYTCESAREPHRKQRCTGAPRVQRSGGPRRTAPARTPRAPRTRCVVRGAHLERFINGTRISRIWKWQPKRKKTLCQAFQDIWWSNTRIVPWQNAISSLSDIHWPNGRHPHCNCTLVEGRQLNVRYPLG